MRKLIQYVLLVPTLLALGLSSYWMGERGSSYNVLAPNFLMSEPAKSYAQALENRVDIVRAGHRYYRYQEHCARVKWDGSPYKSEVKYVLTNGTPVVIKSKSTGGRGAGCRKSSYQIRIPAYVHPGEYKLLVSVRTEVNILKDSILPSVRRVEPIELTIEPNQKQRVLERLIQQHMAR